MVLDRFRGWFRPDPFPAALRAYGMERCSTAGQSVCIGLAPDPDHGLLPLREVPDAPGWVCFLEAPRQAELIRAFAASPRARTVERLVLGTSHDYARKRSVGYDMGAAVAALAGARLPALKRLSLGDMEMLFNGHRLFGTLGDVTAIFDIAPRLEELGLHGHFALRRPVRHARLRSLLVEVEDVGVTGGPLDQETVSNLLLSDLPSLAECALDLSDDHPEFLYAIPDAFFSGSPFPALRHLRIDTLTSEANARVEAWKAKRGVG